MRLSKAVSRVLFVFCCLAVFVLLASGPAMAQVTASASLSGSVVDKNGAVIKGATVSATNKETKLSRTTMTGDDGQFKIRSVTGRAL